ncbi:hypothetical protein GCM10023169_37200 [Georgenia halophila]|uniref:Sulfatase N-terminal domain-containing protein n=1 Tax=Georgenia halophila TaxID=620889 RepID=A0ABP8LN01_9MICO
MLAALLVLVVLTVPNRVSDLELAAFVRLPIVLLALLAVALALRPRTARLRRAIAVAVGIVLGLTAVFKLLDMAMWHALNRPFDPMIDWRYAGDLNALVRDLFGGLLGTVLLVAAAVLALALLVLVPLSVRRLTRVAARHRRPATKVVATLLAVWVVLAVLDVRGAAGPVASREGAGYLYGQISHIPSELRDRREFAEAAQQDPYRDTDPADLLTGLRGKDVLFVFVESLGRVSVEGAWFSDRLDSALDDATARLAEEGFAGRSAFLTSPTFGGKSWLAHGTLQSGMWTDTQQRYDVLVTSERLTLSRLFGRAGWRTVAAVPANNRDWPQGAFYGYDHIYDSRNLGYEGPEFGYATMPDQYTLETFARRELAEDDRPPVMAEIDLISSHAPWVPTPPMIDPQSVGDGSVYDGMPERLPSRSDIWTSPRRVQDAYADSVEYALDAVVSFVATHGDDDTVIVLLGDHQPTTIVSGEGAGHDVPVAILARDPAVLERISGWGWGHGLCPDPDAPVWRMDAFRDRFLGAYGPETHNGTGRR